MDNQESIEWTPIGSINYRKFENFNMAWQGVDISKGKIIVAPFGGPIAVLRKSSNTTNNEIRIYSLSGHEITSIQVSSADFLDFGWTDRETLVCVAKNGDVTLFSAAGELIKVIAISEEFSTCPVLECKFWSKGVIFLTAGVRFSVLANILEPAPQVFHLADSNLLDPQTTWAILDGRHDPNGLPTVYAGTKEGSIKIITVNQTIEKKLALKQRYMHISFSCDGKMISLFTDGNQLLAISSDFSKITLQSAIQALPSQICWSGNDLIVLVINQQLTFIDFFDERLSINLEEPVLLVSECDGLRLISNSKCEFFQKVPKQIEDIFSIGSMAPAALLYSAYDAFQKRDPTADGVLRDIKNDLTDAVDYCIDAAGHQFSIETQRVLLRTASFGKCFCDSYSPNKFVEMCKTLRILSAVRTFEIGIPLTIDQLRNLTPAGLIEILKFRNHHLLATRISKFLKLNTDHILIHWACAMVKSSKLNENTVATLIINRLESLSGISYSEIAKTAKEQNKLDLATKLLEKEPKASDQVPLLLDMNKYSLALDKAIESGDTDQVYLVILFVKSRASPGDFLKLIEQKSVALDLFISYCKQQNIKQLIDFLMTVKKYYNLSQLLATQAFQSEGIETNATKFEDALKVFSSIRDTFSVKVLQEQIRLFGSQKLYESKYNEKFIGLSVVHTIAKLIRLDLYQEAEEMRKSFSIQDQRWWWLKIRALAEKGDWSELRKFANSKKSPIGYLPFAITCIEFDAKDEAHEYLKLINDPIDKIELLIRLGLIDQAIDIASKGIKDVQRLVAVRNNCSNRKAVEELDKILVQYMQ
eukprot:TRINITY_DN6209_c0_g1_i1.p1 TRINITY_DN6209_c0_g1~~TRINITY_DN6209_c0_g1_i1.p1  ORF type:complete len:816 (+),score=338.53 TRINITY_DN6209_c0_g1_i1:40-2487(+)